MNEKICIVGGGISGWLAAAYLSHHNPNIEIAVIESEKIPTLGVGESMVPIFGNMLDTFNIDKVKWLKDVNGILKYGNYFIGWNSEIEKTSVHDHWNADMNEKSFFGFSQTYRSRRFNRAMYCNHTDDDYLRDNNNSFGISHGKSFDYLFHTYNDIENLSKYACEIYHFALNNKTIFDNNELMIGDFYSYAWHIDANLFPNIFKKISLQNNVKHINSKVVEVVFDKEIKNLKLENGETIKSDLYLDCTGFHRLLMKAMDAKFLNINKSPVQSGWVAHIKYKDKYEEMKPYTQSYANKNGWNFIIPLFNRMGSGYLFDDTCEDKQDAYDRFIKYWEGYEMLAEPRFLNWESGYYEESWNTNVVCLGNCFGFDDPLEASTIFVAQRGIEVLNTIIEKANTVNVSDRLKKTYSRKMSNTFLHIVNFIEYHYTMSKRKDSPMWIKCNKKGKEEDHVNKNWSMYRSPSSFTSINLYEDYLWAQTQLYLDRFTSEYKTQLEIDEGLLPLAKIDFDYMDNKSFLMSNKSENVYEWMSKNIYGEEI